MLDKGEAYQLADTEYHDLIHRGSGNQLAPVDHSNNPSVRQSEHALHRADNR